MNMGTRGGEWEWKGEGVDDQVQCENLEQEHCNHGSDVPIHHNSYRHCGIQAKGVVKGEGVEWGEVSKDEVWRDKGQEGLRDRRTRKEWRNG